MARATGTTALPVEELVGTWVIDPAHTRIGFAAKHMMITTVRGSFQEFEGGFSIGEDSGDSRAWARIQASSITTSQADRDAHLRSKDFFEIETHPELVFESTGIEVVADGRARLMGDLTIRGVTRPVTLDVAFQGVLVDLYGKPRASFTASAKINREDFGITWNQALETGGFLVSKDVSLEIEAAAVRADA